MATKDFVLGLSLSDRTIQAVELEQDGPSNTLLAIDEWENTFPLGGVDDPKGVGRFSEYLAAFLKVNRVRARKTSVALDSATLFINSFPLEEGLSRPEINEHINWELSQFFPDAPPKQYVTDIHVIAREDQEHWNQVLSVSVQRRDAFAVQEALARHGLELLILDVDHFSADTALRTNYPDVERKYMALVGVKENRLDISLLRNGVMQAYSYCLVQSNREIVERIGALSRDVPGIHSITVYGPYLEKDLLVLIRRGSALLVEALNPLRHINVLDSLRLADHLSVPSYRFASAVGVALRRD
ncbi:MAG: pilus assembly protein PilM [Bacteroidota bacterium]